MTARLDRPATRDGLFLWVMHRFAEVFENHAVLKGGMALRLVDCPRRTPRSLSPVVGDRNSLEGVAPR